MSIQLWFPTSIYVKEDMFSDEDNHDFITEIENLKSKISIGGNNWNTDVYNTCNTYDLRKNKILKCFFSFILCLPNESEQHGHGTKK